MANVKISQLPSLSTMTDIAQIPVVAGGTTYQITGANLSSYFGGDSYGNANVAANLAALGSNPVSTTGNITGGYILGDGSQLTGIIAASPSQPTGSVTGDLWYDTANQQLKVYTGASFLVVGPGYTNAQGISGAIPETILNNVGATRYITSLYVNNVRVAIVYDGASFTPQASLQAAFPTIYPGMTLSASVSGSGFAGTLITASQPNITSVGTLTSLSVTGNIGAGNVNVTTTTGNLVFGRASATGSPGINSTSSVTVVSDRFGTPKEWVFGIDGSFAGLGNISGGNVNTGVVANTGNLTFTAGSSSWNFDTTGNLTVPGNINAILASPAPSLNNFDSISAANLSASGNVISVRVSASGNITGGNVLTGGLISATGNITGGNATLGTLTLSGNTISSTDAIITIDPSAAGNTGAVIIQGNLSVTGNVTYIDSNTITTNDLVINMANNAATAAAANGGGIGVGPVTGAYATITYNSTANIWAISNGASVTGNVTGGNIITAAAVSAASVSASGNITSGNLNATGLSLSGNVVSALNLSSSLTAATTISAVGNITGGNIMGGANVNATTHTGTTVSVTGNITGGNILGGANVNATTHTGTTVSVTGNITGGNILGGANVNATTHTGTTVGVTGNITGGNVTTAGLTSTASLSITGNTATVTSANYSIGYLTIPQVTLSANSTAALTDIGKHFYSTTAGNLQVTIPDNANVAFPVGAAISIVVQAGGNVLVVTQPSTTLYLGGNATSGNRVVGTYGMATILKVATNTWFISGTGVS